MLAELRGRLRSSLALLGEAGYVALAAMVASATVLLREMAISRSMGLTDEAGSLLAGLTVATALAQLVPSTFQSSAFSVAVSTKLERGAGAMQELLGAISLRFAVLALAIAMPLVFFGEPIARVLVAKADPAALIAKADPAALASVLSVLGVFAVAMALSDLGKSILGLERRYVAYAVAGGLGNLVLAALIVGTSPGTARASAELAGASFVLAAIVSWSFCLRFGLVRFRATVRPVVELRRIYAQAPASFGAGLLVVGTTTIDQYFTLALGEGSYATLSFAQRWPLLSTQLPALALGTVLLRTMAEDAVRLELAALRTRIRHTFLLGLGVGVVMCLGGLVVGPFIVRLTLQGGSFTATDADAVISVQNLLFLQAPFYIGGIVYLRVLNALRLNGIGFTIGAMTLVLNAVLDWAFTQRWHFGVHGIALSTVFVYAFSGTALVIAGEYVLARRARR